MMGKVAVGNCEEEERKADSSSLAFLSPPPPPPPPSALSPFASSSAPQQTPGTTEGTKGKEGEAETEAEDAIWYLGKSSASSCW